MSELETENRVLQAKLDCTSITLSTYVKEMQQMLESHEIANIINMEVESGEEEEEEEDYDFHNAAALIRGPIN